MGFFSKDIKTLEDMFMHGLEDLYYAEKQILKALPDMIEKATNKELRAGFEKHLAETEGQVQRLEKVFEALDRDPKGEKCPAIEGILKEGKELMGEIDDEDVMNVGLVAAAQAVEHYEITRYGALIAWATELGRTDVVPHFKANLAEEKATDAKLTALAERRINPQAEQRQGEGEQAEAEEHRAPRQGNAPSRREGRQETRRAEEGAQAGVSSRSPACRSS